MNNKTHERMEKNDFTRLDTLVCAALVTSIIIYDGIKSVFNYSKNYFNSLSRRYEKMVEGIYEKRMEEKMNEENSLKYFD